ncbi:MFS transporter [Thiomonas sp. FB-6]|uniref:MFS transporter n=1 Tax=Thiomonas sp. FB-6 TaxID=1158291 RepID=UPI00037D8CD3|nr:MFS transporter [Thiomonas sp. FB-6]
MLETTADPRRRIHATDGRGEAVRVTPAIVAAVAAGNAIEYFDFLAYAIFAIFIGKAYFPADSALNSLLVSLAVFGVGFLTRPIGGALFGIIGDVVGRRSALLWTLGLIALGSLGIALTPSYASIGLLAPIVVVACRLLQGLALGGEMGPSSAFLIEIAPPHRRGLYQGWQLASQGLGIALAGGAGLVISEILSPQELHAWGWRIPFVLSALLVPLMALLRRAMPETAVAHPPRGTASESSGLGVGAGIFAAATVVIAGGAVTAYLGLYMTTYALHTLKMPVQVALAATLVVGVVLFVFAMLAGAMCDRYGRRALMVWPRLLSVVLLVPAFEWLVRAPNALTLFSVSAGIAIINALSGGASLIAIPELFPPRTRSRGTGMIYALGVALFGGTAQFVATWLLHATHQATAPAWYVAGISLIAAIAALFLPETRGALPEHRDAGPGAPERRR